MMTIPEQLKQRYNKSHLSYSSVKQALGDMAQFDRYMKGEIKYKSDALEFGTLYDMLLFERTKAMEKYFVINKNKILNECSSKTKSSKSPHLTNEYKSVRADLEQQAQLKGMALVSHEDWQMANDMIDRLATCGLLDTYLAGEYQVGFLEELNGIQVKGFLDCLGDGFISGIKDFYWVVQEKTYPYLPALVKCSDETIFVGEMKFNDAVNRIRTFLREDYDPTKDYLKYEV